ncbi:MAG: hypothetical protein IH960_10480 [Chloroflexi bacterium]|nr:hypothetical protein [Chloroflexota bacterium]
MIDIGSVAALAVIAFAFGTFSYELLRRPQMDRLRLTGMSLFGVIIGEALVSNGMVGGPAVLGFHPIVALVASFAAAYLDVAWREHKVWPWDIIGDLKKVGQPFRAIRKIKVSVDDGSGEKRSRAA